MDEFRVPPGQVENDTGRKAFAYSDNYPNTQTRCGVCIWFQFTERSSIYKACVAPRDPVWIDGKCKLYQIRTW